MHISLVKAAPALYHLYRIICRTLRFHETGREEVDALDRAGERIVFCLWHDELFPLMHVKRQLDIVTVVSASRDGEMLARVLQRLGLRTARGSSNRGGLKALLGAAHLMKKENVHACITVDGPTGPYHKAKDGAFFLSSRANAWIVPVRIEASPVIHLPSWDRFQLPLPFGKVHIHFAGAWKFDAGELNEETLSAARLRLEDDLGKAAGTSTQEFKERS